MEQNEVDLRPVRKLDVDRPPRGYVDQPNQRQNVVQVKPAAPMDTGHGGRLFGRMPVGLRVTPMVDKREGIQYVREVKQTPNSPQPARSPDKRRIILAAAGRVPFGPDPAEIEQDGNTHAPAKQSIFNVRVHNVDRLL